MVKARLVGRNCCGRDVVTNEVMNGASRDFRDQWQFQSGCHRLERICTGCPRGFTRRSSARHGPTDRAIHYVE